MPHSEPDWKVVRRKLADGTVKEYRYKRKAPAKAHRDSETIGGVIVAYRQSSDWRDLKDSTKKNYNYYLRHLEEWADTPIRDMKRGDFQEMRDVLDATSGRGAAQVFMRVCVTLFNWARERGKIEFSPIDRVKRLEGGHLPAWTAEEADLAERLLPEPLRRVVTLARYTGQRRGDLISMTWADIIGDEIRVRQQKTGEELMIPCATPLWLKLKEWRRDRTSTHILTGERGRPWTANHLTQTMTIELAKIGLRPHLNVHGLRKLAAAELAAIGCSPHEIGGITGHRSLAMLQLYTASASQRRLARAAIQKLENASGKRRKTPRKSLES